LNRLNRKTKNIRKVTMHARTELSLSWNLQGLCCSRIFYFFSKCAPVSILSPAAPPPKPYPLGPNFLPWHTLQYRTRSWQFRLVESRALLHILHLKHSLWKESSPTFLDSAAYTALSQVGHLICAGGLKGMVGLLLDH